MADVLSIDALEQLKPFLNKDGVLEIALRGKNKRFAAFQKIALSNAPKGEGKELMQQAINLMNKNNALTEKSIALMSNMAKLQQLGLILSGLNLCATCVGFAIMYAKLDKMSGQINKLMNVVKQGNEVQADYEFKKVISEHSNMLDCRKTQKFYTEEQMRKLVDDEYNVLNMLLDVFMKDLGTDQENLIFSIYSLASMLAVSLRYFDELYYFNNKEAIGDGDVYEIQQEQMIPPVQEPLLDGIRQFLSDKQGIIECDGNGVMSYSIVKTMAEPHGVQYTLTFQEIIGDKIIFIQGSFEEDGTTGLRDNIIYGLLRDAGQVGTDENPFEGWTRDPYDETITTGALMNLSESRQFDSEFPGTPLMICRELVDFLVKNGENRK